MHQPTFTSQDRIVIIGEQLIDSQQQNPPVGSSWVRRLSDMLIAKEPDNVPTIIDCTTPKARIQTIYQRWEDDVLWHSPTWVLIHPGLSDIWHHIKAEAEHMSPEAAEAALIELVEHTRIRLPDCQFVFIDPIHLNINQDPTWYTGELNEVLKPFCQALGRAAEATGSQHVAIQSIIEKTLREQGELAFGSDEAHPETEGHVLLANQVLVSCGLHANVKPVLLPKQTVLFIGDSITDAGRRTLIHRPYGSGYMRVWKALIGARCPDLTHSLKLINRGVGGNTIRHLAYRWQEDALSQQPDHLVLKIGINDVNSWICNTKHCVGPEEYESFLDELLEKARAQNPSLVIWLISPYFLSRDTYPNSYRSKVTSALPAYIMAMSRMAKKYQAKFVNVHDLFQRQLDHRPSTVFGVGNGEDVVHLSETGIMVIAEALYELMCNIDE
jgi:lysophospholipase L1-like esterase